VALDNLAMGSQTVTTRMANLIVRTEDNREINQLKM